MTVVAAWVRKIRDAEELLFVSDSRLSGDGRIFDGCPKILTLPRSDCAIAFAGYTGHAFPMMLQLDLAIASYEPARRRGLDISSLRKHALKIFGSMANMIRSSSGCSVPQDSTPEADFVFGGYSWVKKKFELWSIAYATRDQRFVARPAKWVYYSKQAPKFLISAAAAPKHKGPISQIVIAGDQAPQAHKRLLATLSTKHPKGDTYKGMDWDPFEVVRDMLRDPSHVETIGGAPQVVKVYQYMQTAPIAVYWPKKDGKKIYIQGRPCLGYERIDRWVLDPDTLATERQLPSQEVSGAGSESDFGTSANR